MNDGNGDQLLPPNERPPGAAALPNDNHVNAIVRLPMPVIVRDNIELWFLQLDHWFSINRIVSDNVRFSTVVAALDANLLQQIYDVVRNPPVAPASKYDAVKNAVIRNFSESEQRRAQQFVTGLQLGDKKPSHLLNELKRMGGENQDEKLLKVLWMNRLPIQVQTCLAAVTQPLNALAELADSVMETFRVGSSNQIGNSVFYAGAPSTSPNVSAVASNNNHQPTSKNDSNDLISKLSIQMAQLNKQLAKMNNDRSRSSQRDRSTGRSSSTHRPRSATPSKSAAASDEDNDTCWYHRTYGDEARKCRDPCNHSKN